MNRENVTMNREDELLEQHEGEQHLTFVLGDEEYAVDILRVHEIKGWSPVTPIPHTPEYVKGVINLRGTIVPIVDLRMRFGLPFREYGATTVVIVLNVHQGKGERVVGIVVDAVSDTCNIRPEEVRPAPDFGGTISTDYLRGLATVEEQMVVVLDIDRLLNTDELRAVEGSMKKTG